MSIVETEGSKLRLSAGQTSYIEGLRAVADLLEASPQIPRPSTKVIHVWFKTTEKLAAALKKTGHWKKESYSTCLVLQQKFGPIELEMNIFHENACERIVTGTRFVPQQPAIPEHEEEIVKWKCPDSLLQQGTT